MKTIISSDIPIRFLSTARYALWPGILINTSVVSSIFGLNFIVAVSIGFILSATSGFAFFLNDYVDQDIDIVNQNGRFIADSHNYYLAGSGLLLALALLGISGAYFFVSAWLSGGALVVLLATALYSLVFHRIVLLKNFSAAFIALSPIWLSAFSAHHMGLADLDRSFFWLCGAVFLYLVAREMRFDEFDAAGDAVGGRLTIAHIFRPTSLHAVQWILTLSGAITLALLSWTSGLPVYAGVAGTILAAGMAALLALPLLFQDKDRYYLVTRAAMFLMPLYALIVL